MIMNKFIEFLRKIFGNKEVELQVEVENDPVELEVTEEVVENEEVTVCPVCGNAECTCTETEPVEEPAPVEPVEEAKDVKKKRRGRPRKKKIVKVTE